MKTRRKAKAQAAAAADDAESASVATTMDGDAGTLAIDVPIDLDLDSLSTLLPDVNFTHLNADGAVALLRLVLNQAVLVDSGQREIEECRADGQRKEIELDQALQDRETTAQEMESALQNASEELNAVKEERDRLAASQETLKTQLTTHNASLATSSTELDTLRHRVDDAEREKRELVSVVNRLKDDSAQHDEEVHTLRSNLKQSRQDYQVLESQVRELRSTDTSTKFKLDSLTQQLELSQTEAQRTASELNAKAEEFAKYRRARHAELSQLQATHDALVQSHAATESSLRALQTAHAAQSHQLAEALARVQDLTGQNAEQKATYQSEVAGLRRLVGMMEEREATAQRMVDNIEGQWAAVGDRAERRESALQEEAERERRRADEAERRNDQLEKVLEQIGRGELPVPGARAATPGTPGTPMRNGSSDVLTQGMIGLSPTVAMASRLQRGGKSFTEVYADYVKLQDEYAKKSLEYDTMERTLANVLDQIEERAPILAQQREEYDRLKVESAELAGQLSEALSDRELHAAMAQDTSQKLTQASRENHLLQSQLEDLGRQVQTLLKELGRVQDPTLPTEEELAQDDTFVPAENVEALITNNLVLYRSIPQLQEQNQKILRIVRELSEKMEAEEKEYRDRLEAEQGEAVAEAHQMIKDLESRLEAQRKSNEATLQASAREKDTLRGMLGRAERAAAVGARLPNGSGAGEMEMNGDGALQLHGGSSEVAMELAEVRGHFEAYRKEMGVDAERLKEELNLAQREAAQSGAQLAKANARVDYYTERLRVAQDEYKMQARDLENLSKRNAQLVDQCARMDAECYRATEDLMAANHHIEQMRNECANLRAEKGIWESVQSRLAEENKTLSQERSQLTALMTNVQRMHSDLERSGENDRRRLETQVQMMESQLQDFRTQLTQERDAVRHLTLQKDLDLRELQGKVDKSTQELSKTREALIIAETSKKHLEDRVEDLHRQLQGSTEKLAVYERRPTGVAGIVHQAGEHLPRDQQLEAEVADLRSSLKVAEVDLATARSHVQQFQQISEANEAALASLSQTFDEYKASTEVQLARNETEYQALQEKIQLVNQELAANATAHAELKKRYDDERAAWAADKKTLEETIVDMTTSEKVSESDRSVFEREAREREERLKMAEDRYSREVLAHADALHAQEELRKQLNATQQRATESSTAAEAAKAMLTNSEASWVQQKQALEQEMRELAKRNKEVAEQNALLHQHLESVSTQAARIKQAADASVAVSAGEGDSTDSSDTMLVELRSVVAYLRKEKEIVELQLDLSRQEVGRLKTSLERASLSLQETRDTLQQERERAVEAAASEAQHAELLERINQLTILRESNATLRAESEGHLRRARDLESKLQQLTVELEPAREQARVAQAELQARDEQMARLKEENRRWQERNTQLLTKYDRIDPAEMQSLKEELEQAKQQLEQSGSTGAAAQQALDEQAAKTKHAEERFAKLKGNAEKNLEIFKRKMGAAEETASNLNSTISQLQAQVETLTAERDNATTGGVDVQALNAQVQALIVEKTALEQSLAEVQSVASQPAADLGIDSAELASLRTERDTLLQEKQIWQSSTSAVAPSEDNQLADTEKTELAKSRDEAVAQANAAQAQISKLQQDIQEVKAQNDKFQSRLRENMQARSADAQRIATLEKERTANSASSSEELTKKHAEELQALEQRLLAQHGAELQAAVDKAVADARTQAAVPTSDGNTDKEAAIAAAIAAHDASIQAKHAEEIAAAVESGRKEAAARSRIKDQQLTRAQGQVKTLQEELETLKASIQGGAPTPVAGPSKIAGAAAASPVSAAPGAPGLPRKPSIITSAGGTAAAATAPTAAGTAPAKQTAIRGTAAAARGARGGRGRGGAVARGGAPAAAAAAAAAAEATAGTGVTIAGAAKRVRESEGDSATDDSLAKRLKPADGASTPTAPKPVPIRRDRVPPS